MSTFLDLAGDDSDVATAPPPKKSFADLAGLPKAAPKAAPKTLPAAASVPGGPLLAQPSSTIDAVTADMQKNGIKSATFNGMPLDATSAAAVAPPSSDDSMVPKGAAGHVTVGTQNPPSAPTSWWDKARGVVETALGTPISITPQGVTSNPGAMSPTGQKYTSNLSDFLEPITRNLPALTGLGGEVGAITEGAAPSLQSVRPQAGKAPLPVAARVEPTAGPAVPVAAGTAPDAPPAPVAPAPTLAQASPGLQKAVADAGLTADHPAVARHVEAETLPVPVKLTTGQAAQDPAMISNEMNSRGKGQAAPVSPEFYQAQGQALAKNMDVIRANAAPDVPATASMVDHGQTLIDSYKAKDAAVQADIKAKYQALSDANGGSLPLNGQDFTAAADAALAKQMKGRYVPPQVAADLEDFRNGGPMTFENFENLRTNLAAEARKADRAGDGNAAGAVNIVRNTLEQMPMTNETAAIKPLADAARGAAKARFDALRADPAYNAAANDSVGMGEPSPLADRFFQNYVTRGARANVATMAQNLSADPMAKQTIAAGTIDQLRAQLKADPVTGNFSQDGYNKGLNGISPKLESLIDPTSAQQLRAVGNVAKNAQTQPRGSYVNNSNTATALVAEGAKAAATHGTNMLFGGLPVGSAVRAVGSRVMSSRAANQAVRESTDPAAGLMRLSDLTK